MKRFVWIGSAVAVAALAASLWAGAMYDITCETPGCGFKPSSYMGIGGGFVFEQVQGFCKTCNKPVSLTWNRKEDAKKPEPLAEFWDPMTGTVRRLYACPTCGKPFVAITKIEEFRHCPTCGKASLKHTGPTIMYD